jgi:hypothetical protein
MGVASTRAKPAHKLFIIASFCGIGRMENKVDIYLNVIKCMRMTKKKGDILTLWYNMILIQMPFFVNDISVAIDYFLHCIYRYVKMEKTVWEVFRWHIIAMHLSDI